MTDQLETEAPEEIDSQDIDLDFVAQARESVLATEFDGETLLIDRETGFLNLLNPVGSIVWGCLDGSGTLAELAEELSDAFGAPLETVRQDVLEMVREVGRNGLLKGVARPVPAGAGMPESVEVGEELVPFTALDLDGQVVDLAGLRSQSVLLVNWSPNCGYCAKIAPTLAEMQAPLAEKGVSLVFVTSGEADANRQLFRDHGLTATALLREETEEDFADPFPGMGTPVAYLIDTEGLVVEPLAYGADQVPSLARRAAGVEEPAAEEPEAKAETHEDHADHDHADHDHADHDHGHGLGTAADAESTGPKYIPTSAAVCGPGASSSKKPREWAKTSAYEVGEYHIGVRANSIETDELLGRVFAANRLADDEEEAPDNYSVVIGDGGKGSARGLNLLLWGNMTVVRSRSPRRVLLALASYLSNVVEEKDDFLRTSNVGAIVGDCAILLPSAVLQWLEDVQPRLSRLGVRLVDQPSSIIDPDRLELVVPKPKVQLNEIALAGIPEPAPSRSELPPVQPGRYPLRAWAMVDNDEAEAPLSRARAVAASLPTIRGNPEELASLLIQVGALIERVTPIPLYFESPADLVDGLKEPLAALR